MRVYNVLVIFRGYSLKKTSLYEGSSGQELSKGFFDLPESICVKRVDSYWLLQGICARIMPNEPIWDFLEVVRIKMFLYLSCRFIFHIRISCYIYIYIYIYIYSWYQLDLHRSVVCNTDLCRSKY